VNRQRRWWRSSSCLLLATHPLACNTSPFGEINEQGMEFLTLLGPNCPVASEESPCPDEPYQAWIQIRNQQGLLVTRGQTDENGRLRIGLFPGLYRVRPESGDPFPVASEQEVTVVPDHFTEVTVHFDTGIR